MIVAAFHTNDVYEKEATRLRVSAEQFGLVCDIRKVPDQGSWDKNVSLKPRFVKAMLNLYKAESILLLDTDAIFHQAPAALLKPTFEEDVALFFSESGAPSSGTMFFKNTRKAKLFCDTWRQINDNRGGEEEYLSLVEVTRKPLIAPIFRLGPEYFWVERTMRAVHKNAKPVIEHFMVSKE